MRIWRTLGVAAVAVAACRPVTNGRCESSTQCRTGAVCNTQLGLCVAQTLPCTPACAIGLVCTAGSCVPLAPAVTIVAEANPLLSPSKNQLTVHIESDPLLTLGLLSVEASTTAKTGVARGSIAAAQSGDQTVSLTVDAALQGPGTVLARLLYLGADGVQREARSVSVPVQLDSVGPLVTTSVLAASDGVEGWVPRTVETLTVVAQLTDLGSGPSGATLAFDPCPTAEGVPCAFAGVQDGAPSEGVGSFSFAIPRFAQEPGFEAPVAVTVSGIDAAGNTTQRAATLLIDDKAPVVSATPVLLSLGVTGEDERTWFPGKSNPTLVELSVQLSDLGVGFDASSVSLVLAAADIDSGQDTSVAGLLPEAPDGTVHFKVPTGRISGSEGAVHYSISARDKLGHETTVGPNDSLFILVDDVPPNVTVATPDYDNASPPIGAVCNRLSNDPGFVCGRTPLGAADRALRDDRVPASFLAWDCGAGLELSTATFTAQTGGQVLGPKLAQEQGTEASPCTNGSTNLKHDLGLLLDLDRFSSIGVPDDQGSFRVSLAQSVADRTGLSSTSLPTISGDGTLRVSLWRWRSRLVGQAAFDPALVDVPLTGLTAQEGKTVAVPLAANATHRALQLFGPDGALRSELALEDGGHHDFPSGEVVVADGARLWVPGFFPACATSTCSRLWLIPDALAVAPASVHCPEVTGIISGLALRHAGAGPAVEAAVVSVKKVLGGSALTFVENEGVCNQVGTVGIGNSLASMTGVSLGANTAFFSHPSGFFSLSVGAAGTLSDSAAFVDKSGAPLDLAASPALGRDGGDLRPLFSARSAGDHKLRQASLVLQGCAGPLDCWKPLPDPWTDGAQAAPATHTPVFDPDLVYTVDDQGSLQAFDRATGLAPGPCTTPADCALPAVSATDDAVAVAQSVSAPLLLDGTGNDNPLILVQANGLVRKLHPRSHEALTLLRVGPFFTGQRPVTPVADVIKGRSAIYLVDGGCKPDVACTAAADGAWLWVFQLDVPPMDADDSHWPRPTRDTCNTRSTGASCK